MTNSLTPSVPPIQRVSFVGAGNMAHALAQLAHAAGLQVSISNSRGPGTLGSWVDDLGEGSRAATPRAAAAIGDAVVLAIPFGNFDQLPADLADGKLLIDLTNYYAGMYAPRAQLDDGSSTSSQLVQEHFEGAHVVKAFNTIAAHHITNLARSAGATDRTAIPVAATDGPVRDETTQLLGLLGFDALHIGALSDSWRIEPGAPAFVDPYLSRPGVHWTQDAGRSISVTDLEAYVRAAQR